MAYATILERLVYFITGTADKESWEECLGQGFCIIYSPSYFFNCLGVYCIVRSGTGPWARGRSFRLLRGPTVLWAVGDF